MTIFILNSSNENVIVLDNTISLPGRRRRLGRRSGVGAGWDTCFVPGPKSDLNWFAPNQRNLNFSGSRLTGQTSDRGPPPPHHSNSPDPGRDNICHHDRGVHGANAQFLGPSAASADQKPDGEAQQRSEDPHHHQGRHGSSNDSSNSRDGHRATFQDR